MLYALVGDFVVPPRLLRTLSENSPPSSFGSVKRSSFASPAPSSLKDYKDTESVLLLQAFAHRSRPSSESLSQENPEIWVAMLRDFGLARSERLNVARRLRPRSPCSSSPNLGYLRPYFGDTQSLRSRNNRLPWTKRTFVAPESFSLRQSASLETHFVRFPRAKTAASPPRRSLACRELADLSRRKEQSLESDNDSGSPAKPTPDLLGSLARTTRFFESRARHAAPSLRLRARARIGARLRELRSSYFPVPSYAPRKSPP